MAMLMLLAIVRHAQGQQLRAVKAGADAQVGPAAQDRALPTTNSPTAGSARGSVPEARAKRAASP